MKFEHSTVEKYAFRFDESDVLIIDNQTYHLSGGHAVFMLDTETYTLSVECDWGNYCYRWGATDYETFKQLMCRVGTDYLLRKMSSPSVINWKKTKKLARELYFQCGGDPNNDKERVREFLNKVDRVDENEVRFYDFMTDHNPELAEGSFFVKEFPIQAQIMAEIFKRYLVKQLKEEMGVAA